MDRLLGWFLLPATLFGAGGAFMHSRKKGLPLGQKISEVLGGVIIANMAMPLVQAHTPESWHYTAFFLVGWGGVELIDRIYNAALNAVEKRINRAINPGENNKTEL